MSSLTMDIPSNEYKKMITFKRCLIAFIIFILLYRWYSHLGLSQLLNPPLKYVRVNGWYHFVQIIGLDQWIISNNLMASLFDFLTIFVFLMLFWKPQAQILSILGVVLLLVYSILSPMYMAFSAHYFCSIIIVCFILLINRASTFTLVKDGFRFYILWVYSSAFIWKILHGVIFDLGSGVEILKSNMVRFQYYHPSSILTELYQYLIVHPWLIQSGVIIFFLLEALFVVGFFTKKWDNVYVLLIPIIHITFYYFVDTLFLEWLIFILFFLRSGKVK